MQAFFRWELRMSQNASFMTVEIEVDIHVRSFHEAKVNVNPIGASAVRIKK
jgi:hypothetical protein